MEKIKTIDEVRLKRIRSKIPVAKICSSNDCFKYVQNFYFDDIDIYESMFLLLLNNQNLTIGWVKISQGGTRGTVVDVKLICKYALTSLCESVIIVHNHPSGNISPSQQDNSITSKIKEALNVFEIKLLDHLIVTRTDYFSFADENLLV